MELQTLPIGEQSFVKLRTKNRLYVDKTEFIYRMIQDGTCYFLSRPRRFGKSLLLNTIEAYFQGKKELFEGLYIANQEKEWVKHPVFHLDFSAQSYDSEQKLYNKINTFLSKKEAIYGSDASEVDLGSRFEGLIQRAYNQDCQGVVILVDEYDKPLLEAIGNPELQENYRGKIDSTARIALDQIKSKEYALPWSLDNREKILIGINFSTTTRRPDDWIIERGDGSIIEGGQKKWSEISGQKKVVRNRGKNTAVIFGLIKANPSITRDQLSAEVHIAPSAVQKHIEKLKQGYIVRADGDRGGYWVILKEWEA